MERERSEKGKTRKCGKEKGRERVNLGRCVGTKKGKGGRRKGRSKKRTKGRSKKRTT